MALMHRGLKISWIFGTAMLTGCTWLAVVTAPEKESRQEAPSEGYFAYWRAAFAQDYGGLEKAKSTLTAEYLANPYDPRVTAYVGFAYLWRAAEFKSLPDGPQPTAINDIAVAERFLDEATRMQPDNRLYGAFAASTQMVLGEIHKDEALKRRGYLALSAAAQDSPLLAGFPFALDAGRAAPNAGLFAEALEAMWRMIDICAGRTVDRARPDILAPDIVRRASGPRRYCWSTPLAPHATEGLLLQLGDMLTKAGDLEAAAYVYGRVPEAPNYKTWPFQATLRERLNRLEARAAQYRDATGSADEPASLTTGEMACSVCHADTDARSAYGRWVSELDPSYRRTAWIDP